MFLAMNRFKVIKETAKEFEAVWLGRESTLHEMAGFVEFQMLRGPEHDDHVLYASHTVWENRAAFEAWTRSEQFRQAHARAPNAKTLTAGHPQFEGFEAIQTIASRPATIAAE